jgi:hypothetical protein
VRISSPVKITWARTGPRSSAVGVSADTAADLTQASGVVSERRTGSVRDARLADYRCGGDIFVPDDRGGSGGDAGARADPDRLPLP